MLKTRFAVLAILMVSIMSNTLGVPNAIAADVFKYRTTSAVTSIWGASAASNWETAVRETGGLKVMYWNLECESGNYATRQNLRALLAETDVQPDVLVLAEFCESAYGDFLLNKLDEIYPHMETTGAYTEFHKKGEMRVYSKLALNNVNVKRVLRTNKFLEQDYMQACSRRDDIADKNFEEAYWQRPIVEFDVTKGGKSYHLVAVHLPNPWSTLQKCVGTFDAYLKLRFGTHNPTQGQAAWLANNYEGKTNTMLIGDFNAPRYAKKTFGHFDSNPYQKLSEALGESDVVGNEPTAYDKDGRTWIIDHAFASADLRVKTTQIIPFLGSDHAALYTIIR